jgi:hypothetical protein
MNDKKNSTVKCINIALAMVLFAGGNAQAAKVDEYAVSTSLYKKKHYREALMHIDKALAASPRDSRVIYYKALILTQLGSPDSKKIYADLIMEYPGTEAAKNAEIALNYIDPNYMKVQQPPPAKAPPPPPQEDPSSSLPQLAKIYFTRNDKDVIIDAYVNNRPVKMLLDLGNDNIVFSKTQLKPLNVSVVAAAPASKDGKKQEPVDLADTRVNIKAGNIDRHSYTINIDDDPVRKYPLLGKSFFLNYTYSIDYTNNVLTLTRGGGIKDERNALKFTREGRDIVVGSEIGGKSIKAIFDPTADETTMTVKQAKSLGLTVPEWDEGETGGKKIYVPTVKCGPLQKNNVEVTVLNDPEREKRGIPPTLGKEVCGDVKYTVDEQNKVIRLSR